MLPLPLPELGLVVLMMGMGRLNCRGTLRGVLGVWHDRLGWLCSVCALLLLHLLRGCTQSTQRLCPVPAAAGGKDFRQVLLAMQ